MKNKKLFGVLAFSLVLAISFLYLVPATMQGYTKMCLRDGQSVPDSSNPAYTCNLKLSDCCCEICVRSDTLDPRGVNPFYCYGQTCNYMNGSLDEQSPEIDIISPIEGGVQTSRSVLLDIDINEYSKIERYDSKRRRWIKLCTLCSDYSRKISFRDGEQNLIIKATDKSGNPSETTVNFFVDSKKPRIGRTNPRRGFADGNFDAQIREENPKTLTLSYGNVLTGFREAEVNISSGCNLERRKYYCDAYVDLSDYDGQEIGYWFNVSDIAGNSHQSRSNSLDVDTTFPVVNWLDYRVERRYVYFNISVDELNFDSVQYINWDDRRPRWRKLCSRLKNGGCFVKKSFRNGEYSLDLQILDKAGNSVGNSISFVIDY